MPSPCRPGSGDEYRLPNLGRRTLGPAFLGGLSLPPLRLPAAGTLNPFSRIPATLRRTRHKAPGPRYTVLGTPYLLPLPLSTHGTDGKNRKDGKDRTDDTDGTVFGVLPPVYPDYPERSEGSAAKGAKPRGSTVEAPRDLHARIRPFSRPPLGHESGRGARHPLLALAAPPDSVIPTEVEGSACPVSSRITLRGSRVTATSACPNQSLMPKPCAFGARDPVHSPVGLSTN